jgi:hypothetical protein
LRVHSVCEAEGAKGRKEEEGLPAVSLPSRARAHAKVTNMTSAPSSLDAVMTRLASNRRNFSEKFSCAAAVCVFTFVVCSQPSFSSLMANPNDETFRKRVGVHGTVHRPMHRVRMPVIVGGQCGHCGLSTGTWRAMRGLPRHAATSRPYLCPSLLPSTFYFFLCFASRRDLGPFISRQTKSNIWITERMNERITPQTGTGAPLHHDHAGTNPFTHLRHNTFGTTAAFPTTQREIFLWLWLSCLWDSPSPTSITKRDPCFLRWFPSPRVMTAMRCQYPISQRPNSISTRLTTMARHDVKPDPMANVTFKDRKGSAKRRLAH